MGREENDYWREAGATQANQPDSLLEEMLSRPAGQSTGFDLEREVAARPLLALGAALVAGFTLGSMADDSPSYRRSNAWLAPLDRELDLLKSAALAALTTTATNSLRDMVPGETGTALTALVNRKLQDIGLPTSSSFGTAQPQHSTGFGDTSFGTQPEQPRSTRAGTGIGRDTGEGFGGNQTSSAPNTSFGTGAGSGAVGYDSPPQQGGSVSIENTRVDDAAHLDPYYPPGGANRPIAGSRTPGEENKDLDWR